MLLSLIAAMTPDRIIGNMSGGVPWNLPHDKAHFRSYTEGKWMLVGRKTYEEMEGWFGTRTAVVLTRNTSFRPTHPAHRVAGSVSGAVALARRNGVRELVVSGGAAVYEAALPLADRLVVTTVEAQIAEGIRFPECRNPSDWRLVHREAWPADHENEFGMTLRILDRRKR